jgi:hypothetical protein
MWSVFGTKSERAQGPPPKEDKLVLDLHVTAASVGEATIREDDIKSRGRCVGLRGLALMLIGLGIDSKTRPIPGQTAMIRMLKSWVIIRSRRYERSDRLTPGQVVGRQNMSIPGRSSKRASESCRAKLILTLEW